MEYYVVLTITWLVALSNSEPVVGITTGGSALDPAPSDCKNDDLHFPCPYAPLPRPCYRPSCAGSVPPTSPANQSLTDLEASAYRRLVEAWSTATQLPSVYAVCKGNDYINCSCKLDASNISTCNIVSIRIEDLVLGMLPQVLSNFTFLHSLVLSKTGLYGVIPDSLGDLSSLQTLILADNRLNGSIPTSFEKLRSLTLLNVTTNMLSGSVPPFLGGLPNLTYLYMGNNLFNGTLPAELGKSKSLLHIALWCNRLTGKIPSQYTLNLHLLLDFQY